MERPRVNLSYGRHLFAGSCWTLEEAISQTLESMPPEEVQQVAQRVHGIIRQQFRSVVAGGVSTPQPFPQLAATVQQAAEAFVKATLARTHVVQSFLDQYTHEEDVHGAIACIFDEAAPELKATRAAAGTEMRILAVPPDDLGERFRSLTLRALPDVDFVSASSTDEIVIYREQPHLALWQLPQTSRPVQEAYQRMVDGGQFTPHSRIDIVDWLPVAPD